ncbi:Ankrd17 [Symbiodinium natans]|uniref:Ankrd17 protein n=1 Tax=Symbiodinium natans TaxID=878477 RepID=A0A812I867_9DINO|nr:Ankrd17 [Symbiodinium natans]
MALAFVQAPLSATASAQPPTRWARVDRASGKSQGSGALPLACSALLGAGAAHRRSAQQVPKARSRVLRHGASKASQLAKLVHLGGSSAEKALVVNLDSNFYGSFAEIGAGQEVSRTFLQAGAAAGTVARSISAYDMKMSDLDYGKASRYVTRERLEQMLNTEYDVVEKNLRATKGGDARFFSFASTLAAKAYMSDRECEGWVGLKYQAEIGAAPSTVILHIRMSQPTAQQQGEAIGVLGTNLIYLCYSMSDPYLITSFLLDGMSLSDEPSGGGRIEVDFIDFTGPSFPKEAIDARLLAFRMVQLRIANGVLMEPGSDGRYKMVVPNNALYKRPVIVERSRFKPCTSMHTEVIETAARRLKKEKAEGKEPMKILNLQIDDITSPVSKDEIGQRLAQMKKLSSEDYGGKLSLDDFGALIGDRLSEEEVQSIFSELAGGGTEASVDALLNLTGDDRSILATDFLQRFEMLETLKYPVLLSNIQRTHQLVRYLNRYTNQDVVIAVGGGGYSLKRALFNPESYGKSEGGMLAAFGNLFQNGTTRIFTYPSIDGEGNLTPATVPSDDEQKLYEYLESKGYIEPLTNAYISPEARDPETNQCFAMGAAEVGELIQKDASNSDWEKFVPASVASTCKSHRWFARLSSGKLLSKEAYKVLNDL